MLPLVLAGILAGVVASLAVYGEARERLGLLVVMSVLCGLAANLIVQSWLDVVEGSWIANAAVLSLTVLAIASFLAGRLGGRSERPERSLPRS